MTDTPTPQRPDMLERALTYARGGTPVFPCAVAGKTPLTANGFHDATTDPDHIRTWWTRTPDANIAAPTGTGTFDVLDVDVRPDGTGWAALRRAKEAGLVDGWFRAIADPLRRAAPALPRHRPAQRLHPRTPPRLPRHRRIRPPPTLPRADQDLLPPLRGHRRPDQPTRPLDWAAVTTTPRTRPRRRALSTEPSGPALVRTRCRGSPRTSPANPKATATTPSSGPPAAPPKPTPPTTNPLIAAAVTAGLPEAPSRANRPVRPRHRRPRPPDRQPTALAPSAPPLAR